MATNRDELTGKTEMLKFRVRPGMKEGLKEIFHGQRYSDTFEYLVMGHIRSELRYWQKNLKMLKDALDDYTAGPDSVSKRVVESMKYNIDQSQRQIAHYESVLEKCFPEGSDRPAYEEREDIFGYEE